LASGSTPGRLENNRQRHAPRAQRENERRLVIGIPGSRLASIPYDDRRVGSMNPHIIEPPGLASILQQGIEGPCNLAGGTMMMRRAAAEREHPSSSGCCIGRRAGDPAKFRV
jgi:hypothetical protein